MARKPEIKPATKTAAKKAAPAKRRAAAAKTPATKTTVAKTPVAKTAPVTMNATAPKQPAPKPAPAATPLPAAPVAAEKAPAPKVPAMKMAQVEFSSKAVAEASKAVAEDCKTMSKAAFDAYLQSGNLFAENFGAINREIMSFAQSAMESSLQAARAMTAASSLEEMVELQRDLSKKNVDSFLAESAKLTEMSVELASDSIEPLQSNLKTTVEKLLKPLAA